MDDKKPVKKNLKDIVTKSNVLVLNSKYKLTNIQDRVLRYTISQLPYLTVDEIQEIEVLARKKNFEKSPTVIFNIKDYSKLIGITDSGTNYKQTKAALKSLRDASTWIPDPANPNGEITVSWFHDVYADNKSGDVRVDINPYILRYLRGLQEKFIAYGVEESIRMNNLYSRILYEILLTQSWKDSHQYKVSVKDFREMMQIEPDKYPRFNNLREKCVEVSIKEINALTPMHVEVEYKYSGRSCTDLIFTIKMDKKKVKSEVSETKRSHHKKEDTKKKTTNRFMNFDQRNDDLDKYLTNGIHKYTNS